jgi:hypothetical protein
MGQNPVMATKDEASDGRRDVLTALPRARPTRRSAKRDGARPRAAANAPSNDNSKPAAGPARKRPKKATATAKPASAPRAAARPPRPQVPPAGYATPRAEEPASPLRPAELVTTAVEAVGELAQVGVTVGLQGLRSALRRLPRP